MAHTKAKGTSKLGRDSEGKRLGVKLFGGQKVAPGQIIIRQRGSKFYPGEGTRQGRDDTIFALREGRVEFQKTKKSSFIGRDKMVTAVKVVGV